MTQQQGVSMKIGVSKIGGGGGNKEKYFNINPNEANLYRVLPPLFSLSESGQFAKYYSVHKIFYKDPTNPTAKAEFYAFNCIQKINKDTKLIDVHCPFCDMHTEKRRAYDNAKKSGQVSEDQLKEFLYQDVLPWQNDKKFYVNAVDEQGKVSVLPLGIKAFKALQGVHKKVYDDYQIDVTGISGIYLDFRKNQAYKGDRDTTYTVEPALVRGIGADGKPSLTFKVHELTPEFIEYLKTSARDLSGLYKNITAQDMSILVSTPKGELKPVLDRVFARPEKETPLPSNETSIPGTTATSVSRMEMGANGPEMIAPQTVAAPQFGTIAGATSVPRVESTPEGTRVVQPQQVQQPSPMPQFQVPAQTADNPLGAPTQAQPAAPVPTQPVPNQTVSPSKLSDDDFLAAFRPKQ